MKQRCHQLGLGGIVFLMIYFLSLPTATASDGRPQRALIRVENGLLTASVREITLIDFMNKLADQTGMGFEIHAEADRKITVNYTKIPLDEGLKRLLSPSNFIIIYSDKKSLSKKVNIKRVIVYDKSGSNSGQGIKRRASDSVAREENPKTDLIPIQEPGKTGAVKSLGAYAEQLKDGDPDIREQAISDMADEYKEAALIYLERALIHDGNDDVRVAAAEEIGELESERGIQALDTGLNDPDEDVRKAVVAALGEIGGENALPLLQKALKDKNEDIRESAADLIEEIEAEKEAD